MRRLVLSLVVGVFAVAAVGCTVRHSRTLSNVAPSDARRVSASSSGLEIIGIEINDTETADSLAGQFGSRCKSLKNVEVDYRSLGVLFISIPKLEVSADCE